MNRQHISERPPSYTAYRMDGCRCYGCSSAKHAYNVARQEGIADGTWQPFVDAAPVREYLMYLRASGVGLRRVEELTDISRDTLQMILHGHTLRARRRRVRTENARAIFAIKPGIDTASPGARIDAVGSRRRLRALVALGFPQAYIARRVGVSPSNFFDLMTQPTITARRAREVRAVYDALWNTTPADAGIRAGSIKVALGYAGQRGWPKPVNWDDDEIDDPDAQPHYGDRDRRAGNRFRTHLENVEFIASTTAVDLSDPHDRELVAERLDITPGYLDKLLAKAA